MSEDVTPIDAEIAELCETLREMARRGEVNSIAVAWTLPSGGSHHRCVHLAGSRPMLLLGEMTIAVSSMAERFR